MIKSMIRNKKGFTLIELLMVLGIASLLLSSIGSFLISNIKSFHRTDAHIEVQYQVQSAMNYMVERILESSTLEKINEQNAYRDEVYAVQSLKLNNCKFTYSPVTQKLYDETKTGEKVEFANFITVFKSQPIFSTEGTACIGLKMTIESTKRGKTAVLENEIYFRNK